MKPDVVIIAARGKLAENGEVQAYFEKMKVPFCGSGSEETRFALNKFDCYDIFRLEGLPTLRPYLLNSMKQANDDVLEKLARVFGFPCIVKPNKSYGGKGIYKVEALSELKNCIGLAFKTDNQVLIEPYIQEGVEVRICLQNHGVF